MKILVTGGAGYLGSTLTRVLLKNGYSVTVIDNYMYNQTSLIEDSKNSRLKVINGDARDERLISDQLKRVDAIFPLACLTGAPLCEKDPVGAKTTNLDAIKLILKYKSKNQLVIYPSTQSVYGHQNQICMEETKVKPLSLYSKLKVKAENFVSGCENFVIFRFATIFGVSQRMRFDLLVNDFTFRALKDKFVLLFEPHFQRDYLYIENACKAFVFVVDNFKKMKNQIYNVKLKGVTYTKKQLCEEIRKQIPEFVYMIDEYSKDPDRRNYLVSSDKIESYGFSASTPLKVGIGEIIKAYPIIKSGTFSNM